MILLPNILYLDEKLKPCPYKTGTKVRFKGSDHQRTVVMASRLPLKPGEIGVITSISPENSSYVRINNNGTEDWEWTLFEVV